MAALRTIMLAGGSADHGETVYARAAREFGRRVAAEGWVLRTGGGSGRSIMGAASDGALEAGGRVEGIILRKFWPIRHRGLQSMKAYATFALRKAALIRGASAAAVLPGGYGTLDELGDLLTLRQTRLIRMPVVLVDIAGYYKGLLAWDRHASREGFLYGGRLFHVATSARGAVALLRSLL
ncbi:MAG: LOG family protein [Planctomycetes bacterium]|nr:LOG family protein [Planctomycetota bacterium]